MLHTPSKLGVLQGIIFSCTPDEAMSDGLAKACVPGKIVLFQRKLEFLIENQLNISLQVQLMIVTKERVLNQHTRYRKTLIMF